MGWASANPIFDRTAHALLDAKTEPHIITDVLAVLIEELCDGDWDTLGESIDDFAGVEPVMAAFRRAAPTWMEPEEDDPDTTDAYVMLEHENRKLGWIAARLAWHSMDLIHLIEQPTVRKSDLLQARDHEMGDPKVQHIRTACADLLRLFPDIKSLDDARRKFGQLSPGQ